MERRRLLAIKFAAAADVAAAATYTFIMHVYDHRGSIWDTTKTPSLGGHAQRMSCHMSVLRHPIYIYIYIIIYIIYIYIYVYVYIYIYIYIYIYATCEYLNSVAHILRLASCGDGEDDDDDGISKGYC